MAYTTVMTMMKILEQKGYLNRKQVDRAYVYRPAQPKSRVIRAMVRDFVNRVFNGSAEPLLVHLIEDRRLTPDEIEEIRRLHRRAAVNPAHWLGNLAAWSAQAGVLIAAGSLAAWVFRLRAPRVRLAYGQALLAACLLLPAVEPWHAAPDSTRRDHHHAGGRPAPPDRAPAHTLPWRQALLIVLAAGCAARALWLAVGFGKLRRWRRTRQPSRRCPPRLDLLRAYCGAQRPVPDVAFHVGPGDVRAVGGRWWCCQASFAELPADTQEAIACHELLHVRRHDWIVTVAEQSVRAALWFHPAVWWLIGQVQLAREQTVDGEVVALTAQSHAVFERAAGHGRESAGDGSGAGHSVFAKAPPEESGGSALEGDHYVETYAHFVLRNQLRPVARGGLARTPHISATGRACSAGPGLSRTCCTASRRSIRGRRARSISKARSCWRFTSTPRATCPTRRFSAGRRSCAARRSQAVLQWHYSPKAMTLPTTTQVTMDFKLPKEGDRCHGWRKVALPQAHCHVEETSRSMVSRAAARDELLAALAAARRRHRGCGCHALGGERPCAILTIIWRVSESMANRGTLRIFLAPMRRAGDRAGVFQFAHRSDAEARFAWAAMCNRPSWCRKCGPFIRPEAKAQRIQGIVMLEAIIGKDGKVENLKVLSGDPLLAPAALEAVRQWQYQTTLLNGDPVEVVTQIDVNFTLSQ